MNHEYIVWEHGTIFLSHVVVSALLYYLKIPGHGCLARNGDKLRRIRHYSDVTQMISVSPATEKANASSDPDPKISRFSAALGDEVAGGGAEEVVANEVSVLLSHPLWQLLSVEQCSGVLPQNLLRDVSGRTNRRFSCQHLPPIAAAFSIIVNAVRRESVRCGILGAGGLIEVGPAPAVAAGACAFVRPAAFWVAKGRCIGLAFAVLLLTSVRLAAVVRSGATEVLFAVKELKYTRRGHG